MALNIKNLSPEKLKALNSAMNAIDKTYGAGSVMLMGDGSQHRVDALPTGCIALDRAIGIGGYPKGRIIELYGPESSGKTTVALHAIASCQQNGGVAAFIDAEHALDPIYAKNIGVDIESMIISQPDCGEQAIDIAEKLICSGAIDIVVIDSVAALIPKRELEGDMDSLTVGEQARLMSKAMRKLSGAISRSKCIAIFINQIREKVGGYGNPETTSGGRALKFYASVRAEVRKTEPIKEGSEVVGNKVKVKIVKNKVAPPCKEAHFEIFYGKGISCDSQILDMAVSMGIIKKSGSWFSYGDQRWHGLADVRALLESDPEFRKTLTEQVMGNADNFVPDLDMDEEDEDEDDIFGDLDE